MIFEAVAVIIVGKCDGLTQVCPLSVDICSAIICVLCCIAYIFVRKVYKLNLDLGVFELLKRGFRHPCVFIMVESV